MVKSHTLHLFILCMLLFLFNGSSVIKIKFIAITVQHVIFHFIKCGLWQLSNTGGPGEQTWFVLCQLLASESVELAQFYEDHSPGLTCSKQKLCHLMECSTCSCSIRQFDTTFKYQNRWGVCGLVTIFTMIRSQVVSKVHFTPISVVTL